MIGSPHSRTLEDEIISVTDHQLLMAPFVKSRPGSALAGADRPGLIVVVWPVIAGPDGDRCRLRHRAAGRGGPARGRLEKDQPRQAPRQPPIGAQAARQAAGRQPSRTRRYHVPAGSARVTAALPAPRGHVIAPILAGVRNRRMGRKPIIWTATGHDYENLRVGMQDPVPARMPFPIPAAESVTAGLASAAATVAPVPARVSVMALPIPWWPPAAKESCRGAAFQSPDHLLDVLAADLADGGLGQGLDEGHLLRGLVAGQGLAAVLDDLLRADLGAVADHDDGVWDSRTRPPVLTWASMRLARTR